MDTCQKGIIKTHLSQLMQIKICNLLLVLKLASLKISLSTADGKFHEDINEADDDEHDGGVTVPSVVVHLAIGTSNKRRLSLLCMT